MSAQTRAAEIPLVRLELSDSHALVMRTWPQTRALMRTVMDTHPALPLAVRLGDGISRRWLRRRNNPYFGEITRTAETLGARGSYFFNIVYEWACSTSIGRDPAGEGARMIRVLDWELKGMARHTVIAEQQTEAGPFYNLTWPGYAGIVTGMAPGRFAAAVNQGPRPEAFHAYWLNEIAARWRMLHVSDALPATHLLRMAFETAPDFSAAVDLLMDTNRAVATPAFFIVSGTRAHEGAIVEATGHERRRHDIGNGPIGVANAWLSPDLHGTPVPPAKEWAGKVTAVEDSATRRAGICRLQEGAFSAPRRCRRRC